LLSLQASGRDATHTATAPPENGNKTADVNVKNFDRSLTTVVRAQNDASKTANITDSISVEKGDNAIATIDISAICCNSIIAFFY